MYKRQALNFHGMGTALFAAGDNGKNPNLIYKTVEFKDMGKKQYQKFYFLNNRPVSYTHLDVYKRQVLS